jgi:non-specific serine/threonine protein kinase
MTLGGAPSTLSPREIEVAVLIAEGLAHKEIASKLVISPRTVEYHVANIHKELGVQSGALVVRA